VVARLGARQASEPEVSGSLVVKARTGESFTTGHLFNHGPPRKQLPRGGIVGQATIVDCVTDYDSDFFVGPYGSVLEDAQPLPFQPCKGRLGLFDL